MSFCFFCSTDIFRLISDIFNIPFAYYKILTIVLHLHMSWFWYFCFHICRLWKVLPNHSSELSQILVLQRMQGALGMISLILIFFLMMKDLYNFIFLLQRTMKCHHASTCFYKHLWEEIAKTMSENDDTLRSLVKMGYKQEEALVAIERLGPNASLEELVDFIGVAQMAKAEDALLPPEEKLQYNDYAKSNKRRFYDYEVLGRKKPRGCEKKILNEDDDEEDEALHLPNPMIGFGVPTESSFITHRRIPEDAIGPPYFYYENVALAPKGVWQTISRFLYDVQPEFVDSKFFCAAARKRGYIHNLPIQNRFPLLPLPPRTIHEAFPLTKKWWPSWDTRTKLNCLQTCIGSAKLTERIRKAVEIYDEDPPESVQKFVLHQCRKWNLVWVGRNKVAPLEPDEVETLLGFPRNHTRGGGISRTDRYKSLGNSFQVDTVAYHLSVLKEMYPNGINLLSLFSGIGGAEVALHRLGIPLKNVVSVEKSEVNRNIVRSWWEQTNQKGNLYDIDDVRELDGDRLEQLMSTFGGFDLIVGGSPCNNLAGSNRVSRDGLEGKESSLFFDYFRILDLVKNMSAKYR
ncbi:DNA (cytosine-5)-methyltransferase DRM2 isoform B [Glycine soja]|uniref:DNA (cytosine-5-)-methyltransferase n=1 Tax=Glycine soja TaxID=3848 RepID=A0A445FAK4_GLYSO|nr:DNA (cytosine-5)-methyltransferase DRM2 isoform B [Glycine soja]